MSNDREFLYIHAALAEKQLELREHWRSITQTLNDTYKDRVQNIIRSIRMYAPLANMVYIGVKIESMNV